MRPSPLVAILLLVPVVPRLQAQDTVRFTPSVGYTTFKVCEPVLRIQPGTVLVSSTNFGGYYTEEGGGFPGEVGPIYVEGATPDDMLVVRIHEVVPNHDLAAARLYTDFGGLSNEGGNRVLNPPIEERRYVWRIDRERMTATTELQGSEMQSVEIGCIGICSKCAKSISTPATASAGWLGRNVVLK
jgi:hypothetical protein